MRKLLALFEDVKKGKYTDTIWGANQRVKISAILANQLYKRGSTFKKPSGIVSSKYELETYPAELPSSGTPSNFISTELFKKGTEPSEVSERFSQLSAPTKGEGSESNGTITISWKAIKTPSAINTSYLQSFFKENYGQFASMYLNKRLEYNQYHVGDIGYAIYLRNDNGDEQYLGYTTNTSYSYPATTKGNYTFIVRSQYSIMYSNASKGLTITVRSNTGSTPEPTTPAPEENPETT